MRSCYPVLNDHTYLRCSSDDELWDLISSTQKKKMLENPCLNELVSSTIYGLFYFYCITKWWLKIMTWIVWSQDLEGLGQTFKLQIFHYTMSTVIKTGYQQALETCNSSITCFHSIYARVTNPIQTVVSSWKSLITFANRSLIFLTKQRRICFPLALTRMLIATIECKPLFHGVPKSNSPKNLILKRIPDFLTMLPICSRRASLTLISHQWHIVDIFGM
jgi:hypothetical protein